MKQQISIAALLLLAVACSGSDDIFENMNPTDADWAADVASILTTVITDGEDDYDLSEPPYSQPVDFESVDILTMAFGVDDGYLYMRVDFSGPIPESPVLVEASGEIEEQVVSGQSTSFVMDSDNDNFTGAGARNFSGNGGMEGVDIFFGMSFEYGSRMHVNANYDFLNNDIHLHQGQIEGEFGAGGPGESYVIYRFDISGLEHRFWPAGDTIEVGGWAEAESDLYHEFVNDFLVPIFWRVPDL